MGIFKKIFGICDTKPPADATSWQVDGNRIILSLSHIPELASEGGAVRLEGKSLTKKIFVFRGEADEFHAFENKCSHMGRRLDPGDTPGSVKCCSVSGSVFDMSGKPQAGAAKDPVKTFGVKKDVDSIEINLG